MEQLIRTTSGIQAATPQVVDLTEATGMVAIDWSATVSWENTHSIYWASNTAIQLELGVPEGLVAITTSVVISTTPSESQVYEYYNTDVPAMGIEVTKSDNDGEVTQQIASIPHETSSGAVASTVDISIRDDGNMGFQGQYAFAGNGPTTVTLNLQVGIKDTLSTGYINDGIIKGTILVILRLGSGVTL